MTAEIDQNIAGRLNFAVEIAREAGNSTLRHFRCADLQVDRKADQSPVTVADRAAEQLMRERIGERFPSDGIIGEELGEKAGTSGYQWILDPIDGTKSFIHGVPLYTTLVAVMKNNEPQIGVVYAPVVVEMVTLRGAAAVGTSSARMESRSVRGSRRSNISVNLCF